LPSSRTSKSAAVRFRTTAPDLSRTMTSTETRFRRERNTGCCCAEGDVDVAVVSTTTVAMMSAQRRRKERINSPSFTVALHFCPRDRKGEKRKEKRVFRL